MTDARFPERWLNDRRVIRLSDRQFRGFIGALAFCASNRTDGLIEYDDVDLIRWCDQDVIIALVKADLVTDTGAGYQVADYLTTQTTRAQLDRNDQHRLHERNKKVRQRAHKAGDHSLCTPETCDVSRGTVPGTSRGTTQDRPETGQASLEGEPEW